MLLFLNSLDYCCFLHSLLGGGSRNTRLRSRYGFLARGEAKCDDAGFGYDIVQWLLAAIRNHEPFRAGFGLKGFYYCVLHSRKINHLIHNRALNHAHP
jgi:hypothetical protein